MLLPKAVSFNNNKENFHFTPELERIYYNIASFEQW